MSQNEPQKITQSNLAFPMSEPESGTDTDTSSSNEYGTGTTTLMKTGKRSRNRRGIGMPDPLTAGIASKRTKVIKEVKVSVDGLVKPKLFPPDEKSPEKTAYLKARAKATREVARDKAVRNSVIGTRVSVKVDSSEKTYLIALRTAYNDQLARGSIPEGLTFKDFCHLKPDGGAVVMERLNEYITVPCIMVWN